MLKITLNVLIPLTQDNLNCNLFERNRKKKYVQHENVENEEKNVLNKNYFNKLSLNYTVSILTSTR